VGGRRGRPPNQIVSAANSATPAGAASHHNQAGIAAAIVAATVIGRPVQAEQARPSASSERRHQWAQRFVLTTVTGMTQPPFGFGPGQSGDEADGDDLAAKIPLFAELEKLMSWSGGPVNWDLARQVAISQLAGDEAKTGTPSSADTEQVNEAVRLADLWLDDVADLPSGVRTTEAWSPVQWVEKTLPAWALLCDPVAARVAGAMSGALPEEMREHSGQLTSIMSMVGGMMFGSQVGQALGELSTEVLNGTEIGLPLGPAGVAVLMPRAIEQFGAGISQPIEEVRLYLAAREAAHQRLFGHVPWLRQRLLDTVDAYARGISVDTSAIEAAMQSVDPNNPESLQQALAGGMFEPQDTPEQQASLRRLETLLALIEGWVDAVVTDATRERLPATAALRETLQRRRATGGPAEQTFSTLVGLELRPRRLREAAQLWAAVTEARGRNGRDALWGHPDLLPTADDLEDPAGFAAGHAALGDGELTVEAIEQAGEAPPEEPPAAADPKGDEPA
jgi:putative hydrolase